MRSLLGVAMRKTKTDVVRTWILLGLIAMLSATASASGAAQTGRREQVRAYSAPHGFHLGPTHGAWSLGIQYLEFKPRRGERVVRFEVEDKLEVPVGARAYLDLGGDGSIDETHYFCGASKEIHVKPGNIVYVGIIVGLCPDGVTPTVPTQGVVKATFLSRSLSPDR